MSDRLRIWCNQTLSDAARDLLARVTGPHELIFAREAVFNLGKGEPDHDARACDVLFGQPDPRDILASDRVRLVHLSTAGYTRYDRGDIRRALHARGGAMTNSSSVYADPCAQHVLAMMLALSRCLPQSLMEQQRSHWDYQPLRAHTRILTRQCALIVGFGAIGRRLFDLLQPFHMNITAVRRTVRGDEPLAVRTMDDVDQLLRDADHVINLLPSGSNTRAFFNSDRFGRMKPSAAFYNVGRGDTVDQPALIEALKSGQIAAAYTDVTSPEPLPSDDPLWTTPNCYITPHIAGGRQGEHEALVEHFAQNVNRFIRGDTLVDQIM
jgi:phosphoglycerate dehydrogenase-like enzyme